MSTRRVTFIIGAGASNEFDLPTGLELKRNICEFLKTESAHPQISEALDLFLYRNNQQSSRQEFEVAGNLIAQNTHLAPSIDNFIHTHSGKVEVEFMGKLGIAQSILYAESHKSKLVNPDAPHLAPIFSGLNNSDPFQVRKY